MENLCDFHRDDGTPPPWPFLVPTIDRATSVFGQEQNMRPGELGGLKSEIDAYHTCLLPVDTEYPFPPDKDAPCEVVQVSVNEQIVTHNYEKAVLGHGFSKYRAFELKRARAVHPRT